MDVLRELDTVQTLSLAANSPSGLLQYCSKKSTVV